MNFRAGIVEKLKTIAQNKKAKRALMDIQKNGLSALPKYAMDGEIQGLVKMSMLRLKRVPLMSVSLKFPTAV